MTCFELVQRDEVGEVVGGDVGEGLVCVDDGEVGTGGVETGIVDGDESTIVR